MARFAMVLPLAAVAVVLLPATFVTPPSAGRIQHEKLLKPSASAAQEVELNMSNSNPVGAVLAAAMVGLLAGLVTGPQVAKAGFPEFSLRVPDYMRGIDAANTATKPGEIDFVTRSRIQALQFPMAMEEVKEFNQLIRDGPSKEERLQREQEMLKELAKVTEIPS
eukprot:CAMPEP_0197646946 /NCGR_PEP_ID=MMETSP1338-20131121/23944_1 /TAXON_ID=43686 ORGANISM="Pelagodinium beii, Strain RCC1491" /NCGR_SAMPLE_ID=MMETSP1338 /ASSEMBLY_ACC=CAM_ASM_000754 /LENGTH=164 /DNA_ID=CAMNT_0043220635 /DNA_START=61 /DNA_END=555 /DNA_ORIENTATION=+